MNKNIQISKEVKSKYKKKKIISAILLGIILIVGIYFYSQTGVPSESNKSPETPKETVSTESSLPPLPPSRSSPVSEKNTSEELPPPEPPRTPETSPSKGSEERNLPPLPPSRQ